MMHFDGPVWRPPYEATSQLLQVTAGCTWHRCKFCTLYGTQQFRMSSLREVEDDLRVIREFQPRARRIFLTGANPFVLTVGRLTDIALFQHGGGRAIVVIKLLHVMSLLYMVSHFLGNCFIILSKSLSSCDISL